MRRLYDWLRRSTKSRCEDKLMARSEVWKPVPGHGGEYVASSLGRIARVVGYSGASGYVQICLKRSNKPFKAHSTGRKNRQLLQGYAHHLVALAFLGQPPKGKTQVNHKDLNRSNNRPENLEWCNQRENLAHWRRLGGAQRDAKMRPWKSSVSQWQRIRSLYATNNFSMQDLAYRFKLSKGGVRWIIHSSRYREAA